MTLKVYQYKNCGTCKKALKFLETKKIPYKAIPIRETPPTKKELKEMIGHLDGEVKRLLNTSSKDYREAGIKDKFPTMKTDQILDMLSKNGNLIKRPFVIGQNKGWVGFKEDEWKKNLSN